VNLGAGRRWIKGAARGFTPTRLKVIGAACLLAALGSWALASPVGSSPDEDYHLVSIWCSHGTRAGLCEGLTAESARVPAALVQDSCYALQPDQSAACQARVGSELVQTTRGNFTGAYPPVFYWVDGFFAGHDIGNSVVLMRIVNLVLFLTVFTAVYMFLPPGLRRAQVAGALLTAVPLGMFLVPSINPSGWALLSAGTFLVAILGYLTTEDRRRRITLGALAALTLLIGAGARGDSASYAVVAVAAAFILTARANKTALRRLSYPAILAAVAGIAFLSVGQSGAVNPNQSTATHVSLGRFLRIALDVPALWIGGMGSPAPFNNNLPAWPWGLGWMDTAMPSVVWVGAGGAFAAVLFSAIGRLGVRQACAVGLVAAGAFLVPTYVQVLADSPVGGLVQPRYVLPLLIILAVTAMVRLDGTAFRITRGQRWIIVAALAVANGAALFTNIRRYVTGTDGKDWNLNQHIEWWWNAPVSPMAVCVIGALAFGIAVTFLTTELTTIEAATSDTTAAHIATSDTSDTNDEPQPQLSMDDSAPAMAEVTTA
jgi:hypothetical protein